MWQHRAGAVAHWVEHGLVRRKPLLVPRKPDEVAQGCNLNAGEEGQEGQPQLHGSLG